MSATPIPRSLALTLHGDLDLSILPDLPSGRQKIGTHIVTDAKERAMFRHISSEIEAGHVVYVVCPLIDPSDTLGVISVEEAWRQLCRVFPGGSVAKLHGRMKGEEKEKMLADFRSGKTPVLVTTSVVEVGVDVPRATVMVIEGAERFGLAQLHQLRGRVGRSTDPSVCFLRVRGDGGEMARRRLEAMTRCQNGFELAELDLQFRGPGNLFGDAQSGFPDFKLATLADVVLMKKARDWASHILENDPELSSYPRLREHLDDVIENVHLE
jgi:ATP-dependent DNA helicase RecG